MFFCPVRRAFYRLIFDIGSLFVSLMMFDVFLLMRTQLFLQGGVSISCVFLQGEATFLAAGAIPANVRRYWVPTLFLAEIADLRLKTTSANFIGSIFITPFIILTQEGKKAILGVRSMNFSRRIKDLRLNTLLRQKNADCLWLAAGQFGQIHCAAFCLALHLMCTGGNITESNRQQISMLITSTIIK